MKIYSSYDILQALYEIYFRVPALDQSDFSICYKMLIH